MTRHLLALATWQPIGYIATDTGIPEQTLYAWIRRGHLESLTIEGRILVNRRAVEQRSMHSVRRSA